MSQSKQYSARDQRVIAKKICKILRSEKISCGVLRGNGSTSPVGADKYNAYIVIEPESKYDRYNRSEVFLSYNMNGKLYKQIEAALKKNYVSYAWGGKEYDCFVFQTDTIIPDPTKIKNSGIADLIDTIRLNAELSLAVSEKLLHHNGSDIVVKHHASDIMSKAQDTLKVANALEQGLIKLLA